LLNENWHQKKLKILIKNKYLNIYELYGRIIYKKILVGSIIVVAVLIGVPSTSVVGYNIVKSDVKASLLFTIGTNRAIDEESKDCYCRNVYRNNLAKAEKLLTILKIYIKLILYRYNNKQKTTEKCQEILDIINSECVRNIFCYVLMRMGICIETLGEKVQDRRFIYFMLELTMIPIVILWNKHCD